MDGSQEGSIDRRRGQKGGRTSKELRQAQTRQQEGVGNKIQVEISAIFVARAERVAVLLKLLPVPFDVLEHQILSCQLQMIRKVRHHLYISMEEEEKEEETNNQLSVHGFISFSPLSPLFFHFLIDVTWLSVSRTPESGAKSRWTVPTQAQ
jgi:hypothetical protein